MNLSIVIFYNQSLSPLKIYNNKNADVSTVFLQGKKISETTSQEENVLATAVLLYVKNLEEVRRILRDCGSEQHLKIIQHWEAY